MPSATSAIQSRAGTKGVPRADREAQIVRAACEVFGTEGYAGTSVAVVAARAGISKPLVYQYFGSKEGLFSACLHHGGQLLADEMERIAAGDVVGLERALRTLDAMFRLLEPQPWLWRLFFDRSAPREGAIAGEIAGYSARITMLASEGVGELLHLQGDDDPLDVDAMTRAWMSIFDALVTWWLDHPEVTPTQMTERCVRLFTAVMSADAPELSA
ncbi:TetR/AcrR family transcriptional regulator [Nocardioides sp. DS6]|uniref:TetR/AcrR family transcriptional regulator n=1 Tax=Nocardioides eburneus TaxID=3231482 RepID=A0ABV3T1Q8_9ACTN